MDYVQLGLLVSILAVILIVDWRPKERKKVRKKVALKDLRQALPGRTGLDLPRNIEIDYTFPTDDDINRLARLRSEGEFKSKGKIGLTAEDVEILEEIGIHVDDL